MVQPRREDSIALRNGGLGEEWGDRRSDHRKRSRGAKIKKSNGHGMAIPGGEAYNLQKKESRRERDG